MDFLGFRMNRLLIQQNFQAKKDPGLVSSTVVHRKELKIRFLRFKCSLLTEQLHSPGLCSKLSTVQYCLFFLFFS